MWACADLLEWYETMGDDFLGSYFIADETWVYHYEPSQNDSM
jgi:hypothetical protein